MKVYFLFHFFLFVIVNNVQAMDRDNDKRSPFKFQHPFSTEQIITVAGGSAGDFRGSASCYEKRQDRWEKIFSFQAVTGKAGIVAPEIKREGDEATPAGVYRLGFAFGYDKAPNSRMEYRELANDDKWVDDPEHPLYNRLVRGETDAKSFEIMRRDDGLYKLGIVIGYNTEPIVKYRGSAIFLHVWRDGDTPTSGCVALPEEAIETVVAWLDPEKNPVIMIEEPFPTSHTTHKE